MPDVTPYPSVFDSALIFHCPSHSSLHTLANKCMLKEDISTSKRIAEWKYRDAFIFKKRHEPPRTVAFVSRSQGNQTHFPPSEWTFVEPYWVGANLLAACMCKLPYMWSSGLKCHIILSDFMPS